MVRGSDIGSTVDDTYDTRASLERVGATKEPGSEDAGWSREEATTVYGRALHEDGPPDLIGSMIGEYRVEKKLGEGGMGTVYGAMHPVIGKRAAVKLIKLELCTRHDLVDRFVLEARAVNQIGHPNIVDVFAFGALPDGRSYFVMEWLRGESLAARLKCRRLSLGEALDILDGVLRGLEAAHHQRIVHRDLKPDNVFLVEMRGDRPLVKLLDFGIAKLHGEADHRTERTRSGVMMGTPRYIAPEQARGLDVDMRADVYSLGVMAFEMFAGQPPFDAPTTMDLVAKHLHEAPPRPSKLAPRPAVLDRLLTERLAKDAAERPTLAQVRAVVDELRKRNIGAATASTVLEVNVPAAVRRRRMRVGVGVAGALVLATSAGVSYVELRARHGGAARAAVAVADASAQSIEMAHPVIAPDAVAVAAAIDAGLPATGHVSLKVTGVTPSQILVDGVAIAHPSSLEELDLAPGAHPVEVRAPGRHAVTATLQVAAGERVAQTIVVAGPEIGHRPAGSSTGPGSRTVAKRQPPPSNDDDDGVVSPFEPKPGGGQ
jgi:tRNA A-37 threonylcarbamoyl transferase component Bud32